MVKQNIKTFPATEDTEQYLKYCQRFLGDNMSKIIRVAISELHRDISTGLKSPTDILSKMINEG